LYHNSVGHGIGANLQVFTDVMPVLLAVNYYRIRTPLAKSLFAIILELTLPLFTTKYWADYHLKEICLPSAPVVFGF
jgi:hypothetical protein